MPPVLESRGVVNGKRVMVVLPAYNAARTLERTISEIPAGVVDDVLLVDDASSDDTVVTKGYTGRRLRVLKNKYTAYYQAHPEEIKPPGLQIIRAIKEGAIHLGGGPQTPGVDPEKEAFLVGQIIGAIKGLVPAAQVEREMTEQAVKILEQRPGVTITRKSKL